jgi:glycosyltransferase involved in cell wall biosynthesis
VPTVSRIRHAARAIRLKFRLMSAFGALWPAAWRGGKLLARGRFREFGQKLLNESADAVRAEAATGRPGPLLFLAGPIQRLGGYDHVVLGVLRGLTEAGVNVHRDFWGLFRNDLIPEPIRPAESARRPDQPRLIVAPPHLLDRFRPDRRSAAYTMWETDTLPAGAVKALNHCGLVIVPSRWGADCFRANGVSVPVEVVPLGYDPAVFGPAGRDRGNRCVLGTAGALDEGGLRKNVQRVIDLFRRAFPTESDVRLRVKITPSSPPVETDGDTRIEVIASSLSAAELADWYRSLTAFVNASAGEGFGLHLLEAMACGRPLISATFGGVSAFFDSAVGYEIGYRLVEARNAIYGGRWSDPDADELVAGMREVYAKPDEARRLGEHAARRAARFTWDDTTRKLVIILIRHGFIRPGP